MAEPLSDVFAFQDRRGPAGSQQHGESGVLRGVIMRNKHALRLDDVHHSVMGLFQARNLLGVIAFVY